MYDVNKRQRNPKEQPRMDNPQTLATSGTQDIGRKQTKQKSQHRKLKSSAPRTTPKNNITKNKNTTLWNSFKI